MVIHDFDMAHYVVGSPVAEVFARGAVRVDPRIGEAGDVDTAVTVLTHEDGTLTTIDNSREAVYGFDQRIEAFGSGGMAVSDNPPRHSGWRVRPRGHAPREPLPWFFLERYLESYRQEWARLPHLPRRGRAVAGRDRRRAGLHGGRPRRRAVAARGPAGPAQGDRVDGTRIAVTGATGFVGGTVAAVLADKGHDVVCLVRRDPGPDFPWPTRLVDMQDTESLAPRPRRLRRGRPPGDLQRLPRHVRRPARPPRTATSG